jgi:mannose-6-phosphate isomerase-like protein (cupin superfamily)
MKPRTIRNVRSRFSILETTTLKHGEASSDTPGIHPFSDQIIYLVKGSLKAEIGERKLPLSAEQSLVVPTGTP